MDAFPVTPSFRLDGRRAVVTGAGRGISSASAAAAAAALAQPGACVTLTARIANEIEAVAACIRAAGGSVSAERLDVGAFDILVNNAGTNRPMPMTEVMEADYDAVLNSI